VCRDAGWTAPSALGLSVVGLIVVVLALIVLIVIVLIVIVLIVIVLIVIVLGVVPHWIANQSMSDRDHGCHRTAHQEAARGV
jgi:hypothetical protein